MAIEREATAQTQPPAGPKAATAGNKTEGVPVAITKGETHNTGLTFNLEPGAIVAHPGSAVVFVCG
jgi:hypothetical protein